MKSARRRDSSRSARSREIAALRARLVDAEETLRAIHAGEVDAVVVAGKKGTRVFTLEGAEYPYRALIESMNEGALTLTADTMVLYANQCFAGMVKSPLERVLGSSFFRFLSTEDREALKPLLKRSDKAGSKILAVLNADDGTQVPVRISIRPQAKSSLNRVTIGMVVTDMTEPRRNEQMLRALSHRVVQAQETERGRVALELHDRITQMLCASLFRCQALTDSLPARDRASKREAMKLHDMIAQAAEGVELISRDLRPSILNELGLHAVLRATCAEFADRTSVSLKLDCARLTGRLSADTELALYRILQEALRNVEEHARARHVVVTLRKRGAFVRLVISDDGIGFDPAFYLTGPSREGGLGLLSMRERATSVGGTLKIQSVRRAGTEIEVAVPIAPSVPAASRTRF